MDVLTPEQRHRNMSAIRSRDTRPEVAVRSILHRLGYRFRLRPQALVGKPDVVLTRHRTVVFVDGCFFHRHRGCRYATTPRTREAFWNAKFRRNVARDKEVRRTLRKARWKVVVVWACELRNPEKLTSRLRDLLKY